MDNDPSSLFKALGDPTRHRLLQVLNHHELNVSEIVGVLGQPQSTISRHLKVLRDADLIRDRRDGTTMLYEAANGEANGPLPTLRKRIRDWLDTEPLPQPLAHRLERTLRDRARAGRDFFARVGHRWDQMREEHFGRQFHLESFTALLPREWTVADVGAGTGYLLPLLARTFRKVIAVEPVEEMLAAARSRPEIETFHNITFHQGGLEDLPIAAESVDLALAFLVLHHVPDPAAALVEMARILKPGGRVLVVEQTAHQFREFHERMQDRWWGFEAEDLGRSVLKAGLSDLHHRPLLAAQDRPGNAPDAPELFVLTARKTSQKESNWTPEWD